MSWGIFVDTDSLYLEMRNRFGLQARMDYLRLPDRLMGLTGIPEFIEKKAMIMRHGRGWENFGNSVKQLGYSLCFTDRGVQPVTLTIEIMHLLDRVESGIVLVTASQRVGPIVERVMLSGKQMHIASFHQTMEVDGRERGIPGLVLMDDSWLWDGEQSRRFGGHDAPEEDMAIPAFMPGKEVN